MSLYNGLQCLSFRYCRGQTLFTCLLLELEKISMGKLVFNLYLLPWRLSELGQIVSFTDLSGQTEGSSECSGKEGSMEGRVRDFDFFPAT